MSQPALVPGELARGWLLAETERREPDPRALAEALDRLCGRLHTRLSLLVGKAGFAALLARALHLAQVTYLALTVVALDETGASCLRGATDFAATHPPQEVEAALTSILAHFIGLLVTFIGEALTVRLLGELWPESGRAETNDMGTEMGR